MSLFKCKICGGALEIDGTQPVATCEYCGTKQTLPKLDNDKRANLYDRANHFRRNNEFDKAMAIYEQILNEDPSDAEAYWSIVLCRYGVEYVEDFALHRRVPTINRTQFTAIFDDEDYKSAIKYADTSARLIYESEANAINEIQKNILTISQNEEPFDVFICYKETDASGRRTHDSVLATELYHELTREGFKVFFSRITLEDKLGVAYEPYIFAALHSSKVMVVIGTRREHFDSVWVKNEWSRYLALIKNGARKTIIPAYRDMDPYDLPEEFSHLQAQDMSKLGFMQDLIRGIKKIASSNTPKEKPKAVQPEREQAPSPASPKTEALVKRIFLFIEEGDIDKAEEYCEKVLDIDPENAQAYLAKLFIDEDVSSISELIELEEPFEDNLNYQRALRYGDEKLKSALENCVEQRERAIKDKIYSGAKNLLQMAQKESDFLDLAETFEEILDYEDSEILAAECRQRAEMAKFEEVYTYAKSKMLLANKESYLYASEIFNSISGYKDSASLAQDCRNLAEEIGNETELARAKRFMTFDDITSYVTAIDIFKGLNGFKDADEQIAICERRIADLKEQAELERIEAEKRAKRNKKVTKINFSIIALFVAFIIVLNTVIIPNNNYNKAVELMNEGKYTEAISAFNTLNGYKDSKAKITECNNAILDVKYNDAVKLMNEKKYTEAISAFNALNGYKDSKQKIDECNTAILDINYNDAVKLMNEKKYAEAITAFAVLNGYKDSKAKITMCNNAILDVKYNEAVSLMNAGKYTEAISAFNALNGHKDSANKSDECSEILDSKYNSAVTLMNSGKYSEAISIFKSLNGYKDSTAKITECNNKILDSRYNNAVTLMNSGKYSDAISVFEALNGYKDSAAKITECNNKISDSKYNNALALMSSGRYSEALDIFKSLNGYKDSKSKITECNNKISDSKYNNAVTLMSSGKYCDALGILKSLNGYKDSTAKITECENKINTQYNNAVTLMKAGKYSEALAIFNTISSYKDSATKIAECNNAILFDEKYNNAVTLINSGKYYDALGILKSLNGYKDSTAKITECENKINAQYNNAVTLMNAGKYSEALAIFNTFSGYKDSTAKITECENKINTQYNNAVTLMKAGKYSEALAIFNTISSYKDSTAKIIECNNAISLENKVKDLKSAQVGDYVLFGAYEQDNNISNGKEYVEWLVLAKEDNKILVISKYALDCQRYHSTTTDVRWDRCSLRNWLNNTFINNAFSSVEQTMIFTTTLSAENIDAGMNGYDTQDKIFLLSTAEAKRYFSSDSARACEATAYAKTKSEHANSSNGNCLWWLRSPGVFTESAANVEDTGKVNSFPDYNVACNFAVRPAMWIDLSK